jgi:hypothetical protein
MALKSWRRARADDLLTAGASGRITFTVVEVLR